MNSCLPLAGKLLLNKVQNGITNNLVVSPLSLSAIAAMVGAGCSGRSLGRLLSFVGTNSLDDFKSRISCTMSKIAATSSGSEGSPKISFANGVWVDKRFPLKPSYQQRVRDVFKSEVKNVDFFNQADEVVMEINSWAEFQTNGLIKSVVQRQHIGPLTALILGNALYFKGYWENKFNPERTEKREFYLLDGDEILVPFMTSSRSYLYGSFDGFKVLEIPYQCGRKDMKKFSMQFFLPNEKDGLQNLLEKFNADSSGFLKWCNFQLGLTEFNYFWIPKFKFSCTLDNIKYPFMEAQMEMTEMVHFEESGGYPFISNIIQKAFIEVDEQGTEAAAVTFSGFLGGASRQLKPKLESFVADHPFMFIIREETSGLILFAGAVLNPLQD